MNILNFLLENKDAILTFIFALIFRGVEKPLAKRNTLRKVADKLHENKIGVNTQQLFKDL